jgi:hypothetical protein
MWTFLAALLIGRATGGWRYMRAALLITLIGCVIVGLIYAVVIFNAVRNMPEGHHVQHHSSRAARTYPTGKNTHSEQDWVWVVQQLSLGEDAGNLTLALASRRSDKPNPLYYAQRTIDIASARLSLLEGVAIEGVIAMLESRRSAEVPAPLCSSRAREIATTAQRMIERTKFASTHHPKENHHAIA